MDEIELFTEGIHPPEDLPNEVIMDVIQRLKDDGVSFNVDENRA